MSENNRFLKLWGMPLLMAFLCLSGLIAALVGDGVWDGYAWVALGVPMIIAIRYWYRPAAKTK